MFKVVVVVVGCRCCSSRFTKLDLVIHLLKLGDSENLTIVLPQIHGYKGWFTGYKMASISFIKNYRAFLLYKTLKFFSPSKYDAGREFLFRKYWSVDNSVKFFFFLWYYDIFISSFLSEPLVFSHFSQNIEVFSSNFHYSFDVSSQNILKFRKL